MQHGGRAARMTAAVGVASILSVGLTGALAAASVAVVPAPVAVTPATTTASSTAAASTASSNGGATPTENNPWTVAVTAPIAGDITIVTNPTSERDDSQPLADVTVTAPTTTAADPLRLTFRLYIGDLPEGTYPSDVRIYLDDAAVTGCPNAADACITSTSVAAGIATYAVVSSKTAHWRLDTPVVGRLSGADRFATAVAASQAQFESGGAGAVVLARADDYADALVGIPLAAAKNAPLLLTSGSALPPTTLAELVRVLGAGGRLYLLGGTSAIPASVELQLKALGYATTRVAGTDRYATAVAVADVLGDPTTVLLATGTDFADALAAGPAAAHVGGAVLLTNGATMPSETAVYLSAHAKKTYAIGGPAAAAARADAALPTAALATAALPTTALSTARALVGADRYATAVEVATTFFATPPTFGVAADVPDALAAGALLAHLGAPLVFSGDDAVAGVTLRYVTSIAGSATSAHVFGGLSVVSDSVRTAVSNALMQESSY